MSTPPPDDLSEFQKMQEKKRKMAVMAISSLVLVAMVVAVGVGVSEGFKGEEDDNGETEISTSNKAIESICQPTDYRQTCVNTLESSSASNSSDPSVLIQAAFAAGVAEIKKAVANSDTIKEAHNDPRTAGALDVCKQVMGYAVGDLDKSISRLQKFELSQLDDFIDDLKTWLGGSITFHEACIDAFQNTTGDAAEKMKTLLNTSRKLSSNGLAMAAEVSTLVKTLDIQGSDAQMNRRKLLSASEVLPHWIRADRRRLMQLSNQEGAPIKADIVVAKDGSGKYKTIGESLKEIRLKSNKTFVVHIKEGEYAENVEVTVDMWNVVFIGDGPTKSRITGNKNFADGVPAYQTATVAVMGDQFMAKDIGFQNTAGPDKRYAVALLSQSDRSIFHNCHMDGHTYTLYAVAYRQFYRDCTVSGSLDFIVGDAAVILQSCRIVIRPPAEDMEDPFCSIVAQGRAESRELSGTVLQNCTITADKAYLPVKDKTKSYLGRPWKKFSKVVVMESQIDDVIDPEGWKPWMGSFGIDTCFFTEYDNKGEGADLAKRVKWQGIHTINPAQAESFTPKIFFFGDEWVKPTGVPYVRGMVNVAH